MPAKLTLYVLTAPILAAVFAPAQQGLQQAAGISALGAPHNFTDHTEVDANVGTGFDRGSDISTSVCAVCHPPHDAERAQRIAEQGTSWAPSLATSAYTLYSGEQDPDYTGPQPVGSAKVCLGCHDGLSALGTLTAHTRPSDELDGVSWAGGVRMDTMTVLTRPYSHPISVPYSEAGHGLLPKSTPIAGSGTIEDILEDGRLVQCSSCHDVHVLPGGTSPGPYALRQADQERVGRISSLCLNCHIK